jgi:hypothetical protein
MALGSDEFWAGEVDVGVAADCEVGAFVDCEDVVVGVDVGVAVDEGVLEEVEEETAEVVGAFD